MNFLIVSPHRDDAAFSLALAISGWLAAGHRVTVLGVFTRSLTAPYSDADTVHPNDLLSYVSAMRRREDAEVLKLMPGLRMVDMNLKDAPLRLRCPEDEVYTSAPSAEDTAIAKIHKVLVRIAGEDGIDAILIPLALGHHVDHLVVRNAVLPFAAGRPLAFYEDLPDAFESGSDRAGSDQADSDIEEVASVELRTMRDSGLFIESVDPVTLTAGGGAGEAVRIKRRIVSVYASQIDTATIDAISHFATMYAGGERVWANAAWLALSP